MWTTVYITNSKKKAINIEKQLQLEGFLVKIKTSYIDGVETFEVLTPDFEANDVNDVLFELGIL